MQREYACMNRLEIRGELQNYFKRKERKTCSRFNKYNYTMFTKRFPFIEGFLEIFKIWED